MNRPMARFWLYPATVWLLVLVGVFAIEYAVMLALPWVLPQQPTRFLEATVDSLSLMVVVAPLIWLTVVRPLREVIRLRSQFLTDLFAQIEADRRRTAHEMHDGVGQTLSMLVSGLRSAHQSMADADMARRYSELERLAQAALKDVKRLALGLRPSMLDDLGLAPALERLAADVGEHHPLQVTLDVAELENERLDEAVETAIFRIIQEALANVAAHAKARSVSVALQRKDGAVELRVDDDGCGFAWSGSGAGNPGHLGLIGMQERAALLGGHAAIESAPGRGTRIFASIPARGRPRG